MTSRMGKETDMRHAYYSYSKEELVSNNPKLPVIVMEDNAAVFPLYGRRNDRRN